MAFDPTRRVQRDYPRVPAVGEEGYDPANPVHVLEAREQAAREHWINVMESSCADVAPGRCVRERRAACKARADARRMFALGVCVCVCAARSQGHSRQASRLLPQKVCFL